MSAGTFSFEVPQVVQEEFHRRVCQHGPELLKFVAEELHSAPPAISITLGAIEWPPNQVNFVWYVGFADLAAGSEQAALRWFQTEAGERALDGADTDMVEFKIATTLTQVSAAGGQAGLPPLPPGLTTATLPFTTRQDLMVQMPRPTPKILRVATSSSSWGVVGEGAGWLQVSPHMHFTRVSVVELAGQTSKSVPIPWNLPQELI